MGAGHMPGGVARRVGPSGAESGASRAGRVDPTTGLHLCAKHGRLGGVSFAGAVELVRSALQPVRPRAIVPRVKPIERHTHKNLLIDYSSGSEPLPWAVDAATLLGGFNSFAEELFLIGEQEVQGSRLQRAIYTMAKWLFDMGDGARL